VPPPGGGSGAPIGIGSAGPDGMSDVAIVGGSEETRLLLRGLVRLHRYRVVFEGPGPESLRELPSEPADLVVLIDGDLESEEWAEPIQAALRAHPTHRAILIAPSRSPRVEQRARELGFTSVLRRPFAVHELVEVIATPPTPRSPEPSHERPT